MKVVLEKMKDKFNLIKKMWVDMGYQGQELKSDIKRMYGIDLEVVKRSPCRFWVHKDTPKELLPIVEPGFKVQPKRWIVEWTFAWLNRNRRLSKEYDLQTKTSETLIYLAMNRLILRRLCN